MVLRPNCRNCGQRHATKSLVFTDQELSDPETVRDVKNFAASLNIPKSKWLDHILNVLARLNVDFVNANGEVVSLNTEIFLPSDKDIDEDRGASVEARIQNWFGETLCYRVPDDVTPRIRREARERFRIVATILRAQYPCAAIMWGVRAANDNVGPIPPTAALCAA